MAPSYQTFKTPYVCCTSNTTNEISLTPSWPTPMQGESFSNCPLMAALASTWWVNRMFIVNNSWLPDAHGNYTFTFWDYGVGNPMTTSTTMGGLVILSGVINPVNGAGSPTGVRTIVPVSPQVLLDAAGNFSDPSPGGTFYGAGPSNANEVWPALFERAYAKFCYYEYGIALPSTGAFLTCAAGVDPNGNPVQILTGADPTYSDVLNLGNDPANPMKNQWGGNAGVGLAYLTGRNCFQLSTTLAAFAPPTTYSHVPAGAASPSLYTFIKNAFCSAATGQRKTRYPLVAWTYANGSQLGDVTFNTNASLGIVASHCYSILGTFDATNGCTNGHSYIVLRTTFGLSDPTAQPNVAPNGCGLWTYGDLGFQIWSTPASGAAGAVKTLNLSTLTDAIFGLDATQFSNYFQSIAWA